MPDSRATWVLRTVGVAFRTDKVSSIGLQISYPDRDCDLNIYLPQPVDDVPPETEFVHAELRRLRDALDHILAAESR